MNKALGECSECQSSVTQYILEVWQNIDMAKYHNIQSHNGLSMCSRCVSFFKITIIKI